MSSDESKPVVLIVGAGLGGLLLGALLERIDIPYFIFERASKVKPLGSAMSLGVNILPVFEQLGLMEELKKFSYPCPTMTIVNPEMKKLGSVSLGMDTILFARPHLYDLLLKQVPPHKINFGKKVLQTEEKEDKVYIHCADNSTYEGDILVGADGAYSGVRQSLYRRLNEQGILPKSDLAEMDVGYTCMVGVTSPQDPEKYPQLKNEVVDFEAVVGDKLLGWGTYNIPDNQICWILLKQFENNADSREQHFRNSEWGPETNEAMIKEFYNLPCPFGGKMGDMIDATPTELISKVYLEEKLFDTWHHGRMVLVGDSCHKMLPGAGQGAINAMQDAVILSNCLYDLPDKSAKNVKAAFEDYFEQRYQPTKKIYEFSAVISSVLAGQTFKEKVLRKIVLDFMPTWLEQHNYTKQAAYRPQITWMPFAVNNGTGPVLPQKPSKRYAQEKTAGKVAAI
ncbi:hypothetical protein BG011_003676 [Mortierella polycephala]|uniref:FAD-binding domain-containing protein n=1 Tax=Mortierella polycephala TaxID=41804 RepID=A0A9P6Q4G8_9FUNG|nr:hypothetical protein BG011_003676 [Mortierella polycephala]